MLSVNANTTDVRVELQDIKEETGKKNNRLLSLNKKKRKLLKQFLEVR